MDVLIQTVKDVKNTKITKNFFFKKNFETGILIEKSCSFERVDLVKWNISVTKGKKKSIEISLVAVSENE